MHDPSTPLAALLPHTAGPYLALMLIGFGVGALGHLTRTRLLVAVGVALVFIGAALFPLVVGAGGQNGPSPAQESRGDA